MWRGGNSADICAEVGGNIDSNILNLGGPPQIASSAARGVERGYLSLAVFVKQKELVNKKDMGRFISCLKRVRPSGADYEDGTGLVQSMIRGSRGRSCGRLVGTVAVAAGLCLSLSGCGMSSITSGLGSSILGSSTGSSEPSAVNEQELLAAAKAGGETTVSAEATPGCPKFTIYPRDQHITVYEPGRVGDGLAIMHRGEITKTSRECVFEQGRVTVKYGFAGRVLLGPRGKSGPMSLPIEVYVTNTNRDKVTGEKLRVDAMVAVENPIGYFSTVRSVSFDVPEGSRPGEFEVFVGFERNTPNAG